MLQVTSYMARNLILIILVAGVILLLVPAQSVQNLPLVPDVKNFLDTKVSFAFEKWLKPTVEEIIGDVFDKAEDTIDQEVHDRLNETEQGIRSGL